MITPTPIHPDAQPALRDAADESGRNLALRRELAAALAERGELIAVLAGLCASFECYAAGHKPADEWDEYDTLMFPRWLAAMMLLARHGRAVQP